MPIICLLFVLFAPLFSVAESVRIDGSSTVFPITEAVAEEFQTLKRGAVKITVGVSGTGGGFKKFCRGEIDVQDASRPILKGDKTTIGEMESCRQKGIQYFEIPVGFDATAIVTNKENTWLKQITLAELKKIWEPSAQGKILRWKDVNPAWPDLPLKLYGAGSDSGTFDYFTEAVVGKSKSSRGDYTASEDDNVLVKGVASDKGSLGYLPFSYYSENTQSLKLIPVVSPKTGQPVPPSRATVEANSYIPLSRPLFIYINAEAFKRPAVKEFVEFYLANASRLVESVKYIPLTVAGYNEARKHLSDGKLGTAFAGHSQVGISIEKLLKMEKSL